MAEVTEQMIDAGVQAFRDEYGLHAWESRSSMRTVLTAAMKAKEPKRHETQLAQAMREMEV